MAAMEDDEVEDARSVEGGTEARLKIKRWILPFIEGPEMQGDVTLTLFQKAKLGEKEVDKFIYEAGSGVSIDEYVGEIVSAAEDDACELIKKISYSIRCDKRVGRCAFSLFVPLREGDEDDEEMSDELPNAKGLAHQAMRHVEVMARTMIDACRMNSTTQTKQIQNLSEENMALKRYSIETMKTAEDLISKRWERDLQLRDIEKKEKRQERIMTAAEKILPVVATKLLGGGAGLAAMGDGEASPIDALLDSLVTSLEAKPEKFQALMQVLDPVDIQALSEIHTYVAKKREQVAGAEASPPASPAAE